MLKPFFSKGARAKPDKAKVVPSAVRLPHKRHPKQKATYEVRMTDKTERVFHKWDDLIIFMSFPPERGPELFTTCFENRGEWVEFSDEATEEDDAALNTPLLYECTTCATMDTLSPLQSVMTTCACGGTWKLVDISECSLEPLPSQRYKDEEKKSYDF